MATMRKKSENHRSIIGVEMVKLDRYRNAHRELGKFDLYRYPSPTKAKNLNSLSKLRNRIREFFEQYEVDGETEAKRLPLPSDLAMFLGFSSYRAMAQAINSPTDPEWSAELERAVEHINAMLMRSELDIATQSQDIRGIDNVIKRIDKINDSTLPKEADPKSQVNIQINIEHKKKIDDFVMDRISSLMDNVGKDDGIEDAEFEEAEDD